MGLRRGLEADMFSFSGPVELRETGQTTSYFVDGFIHTEDTVWSMLAGAIPVLSDTGLPVEGD